MMGGIDNATSTRNMSYEEVTFDDVAAAAASIQDDGAQVTIGAVRDLLGTGTTNAIHKHLAAWRASNVKPAEPPKAEIPESILADLANWVRQYAEEAGAGARDTLSQSESDLQALAEAGEQLEADRNHALATLADRDEQIERLTAELRDARRIATEALVGKAKDQLAIDGKDAQLADLRAQIERNVASAASLSDARLAAEMELIGAVTARDALEAEVKELRAKLDAAQAERNAWRPAVVESLRRA
jgi:chromosome segregation ATPase